MNSSIRIALFVVVVVVMGFSPSPAAERPNVVVILTDDQGWGDCSIHGNKNLSTPHLDALAKEGASFENFYVCSVCAPTRAEFLTGRYHRRTGVSGVSRGEERMNADEWLVSQAFQLAGYATAAFGKWHNGTQSPLHPNDRGFDEFYGFTSGHWGHYFSPPLDHNGRDVRGKGFLVDDLTDHAIEFIREHKAEPFFCYLPLNTPHSPMMVPDRFYKKFDGAALEMQHRDPRREDVAMTRAALAMCENIDWNVGRVLTSLESLGLANNTIVVFFCDNGPNSYRWNGGMKGRKGSIDEGGLRSPLFVRWPKRIRAGLHVRHVVGAIDLFPTLAELAGVPAQPKKPLDGLDVSSLLSAQGPDEPAGNPDLAATINQRMLVSVRRNAVSLRSGVFRWSGDGQLFDLSNDRGQTRNVAEVHPDVAARLKRESERWRATFQELAATAKDRPFHVGHGRVSRLPARDGVPHGAIQRSSKAPNNSFFTKWSDSTGAITWDIDVGQAGDYEVTLRYTCAEGDQGVTIVADFGAGIQTQAKVGDVFDPPLYDKSKERVEKSHYFVKNFKPLSLGRVRLTKGRMQLRLSAKDIQGAGVVDVHSVDFRRVQ